MYIQWLHTAQPDPCVLGELGARLATLAQAGYPVPKGFVVTPKAFKEFIVVTKLHEKIFSLLKAHSDPAVVSQEIQKLFKDMIYSQDLKDALLDAYQSLGTVHVQTSSVTHHAEKIIRDVSGDIPLMEAVKACWGSLFHAKIIASQVSKASVAVLVQQRVAARNSGVLYTTNPVSQKKDELVIEATTDGAVDAFILNKSDLEITHTKLGHPVQAVSRGQIKELAKLGRSVEQHFGKPQEVSWAIDQKEQIVLLNTKSL